MKVYTAKDYVPKDTWIYAIYRHPEHIQPRLDLVMYHDDDVMFGCAHDKKGWIPMGFVLVDDVLKEFAKVVMMTKSSVTLVSMSHGRGTMKKRSNYNRTVKERSKKAQRRFNN